MMLQLALRLTTFLCVLLSTANSAAWLKGKTYNKNSGCVIAMGTIHCSSRIPRQMAVQMVDEDNYPLYDSMDAAEYNAKDAPFYFRGCATDSGGTDIDPELLIIHFCKGNQAKRVRVPIPKDQVFKIGTKKKYYKFPKVIDLENGKFEHEEDWPQCATC